MKQICLKVKAEIEELKKDVDEYKEDVKEIEEMTIQSGHGATKLTETKSAKLLSKRVQKLLGEIDQLATRIEKEKATPIASNEGAVKNAVSIDELMETIKRFKGIFSKDKEKKLIHVLQTLDKDKDGKIDDLNDVLKVRGGSLNFYLNQLVSSFNLFSIKMKCNEKYKSHTKKFEIEKPIY